MQPGTSLKIPLNEIAPITSGNQSIANYLHPVFSFDVSMFLRPEENTKERAYTLSEKREKYPNAYKPWNTDDDKLLVTLHYENRSIKELVSIFKRNEGAIQSRIRKLIDKASREK